MLTQIKKLGKINNIKVTTPKEYNLSEMIQESYTTYYKAKKDCNNNVVKLAESHIANVKRNPTNLKNLSEDLDVLKGIVSLGKDVKECDEVPDRPKARNRRMRPIEECDDTAVDTAVKKAESSKRKVRKESKSWDKVNSKNLKSFKENARNKVFYKELSKFNKDICDKKPITITESMNLYKASNSCLTHLTVELNRNPKFASTFNECTDILASDNMKLLSTIREGKVPSIELLESFTNFTNILLESDTEFDKDYYKDLEEEDLLDREDDEDLLESEEDPTEEETVEVDDVVLAAPDDIEAEDELEEDTDVDTVIDITEEELAVLKSVLSKILPSVTEDVDTVPDETLTDNAEDEETDSLDSEIVDDTKEDELNEEDLLDREDDEDLLESEEDPTEEETVETTIDTEDEEINEEDDVETTEEVVDTETEIDKDLEEEDLLDREDDEDLLESEEDPTEEETVETVTDEELDDKSELTESAKLRIKKCF